MMSTSVMTTLICKALALKGKKALKRIDANCMNAQKTNTDLLLRLMRDNKDTEYGKLHRFGEIGSVEDFRKNVPFSDYDTYAPYIERMVRKGEKNLITAYDVIQYAETSGTVGVQKKIPVTKESMACYSDNTITRVCALAQEYYEKKTGKGVPVGMGLNTLETESTLMDDGTPRGSISGSAARTYKKLFPFYLTSPLPVLFPNGGMNMQYMKARFALEDKGMIFMFSTFMTTLVDVMNYMKNNWEMIVEDIENGTVNEKVCETAEAREALKPYLKKMPERAKELRKIFEEGFDTPIIPKLWPKMSWVCAIGTGGFASYTEKMRQYLGEEIPIDYSIYGASEGMFAAARHINDPQFVLLTDSCFYEFIPADEPWDGESTLTLDQLKPGREYEIVITNQCGFYRYRIQDVIRVLGYYHSCPLITFAYRKSQVVNLAAEKTTEEHLNESVKRLGKAFGCTFPDFSIFVDTKAEPSRYVMLVEPDRPLPVEKGKEYSEKFEEILCDVNPEYAVCRYDRSIGDPLVLLQQQQTHAFWRELKMHKGTSSNQVKPVRVLDVLPKQKFFFGLLEEGQEKVEY